MAVLLISPVFASERCRVNDTDINAEYYGDCEKGLATGRSIARGRNSYQGSFENGNKHGEGMYTWANGNTYEGDYKDDRRNGRGVFTFANGDKYEGDFRDDKRHGVGAYNWANGSRYVGEYRDDEAQRPGSFHLQIRQEVLRHMGEWNDKRANARLPLISRNYSC